MFVSHTYKPPVTPTVYTHALSLSLSLCLAHTHTHTHTHRQPSTQTQMLTLSHSARSSFTAKERGGGDVRLEGLNYLEEKRRAVAFLLALSGCLCERAEEANK